MPTHRDGLIAATALFIGLDGIVVAARVYTRTILIKGGFGWDDFFLCLTYVSRSSTHSTTCNQASYNDNRSGMLSHCLLDIQRMHYGYAAPPGDEQPYFDPAKATQFTYANQTTLYISAGLVKIAVALVLFRLTPKRGFRRLLVGSVVVVAIWTIITVIFASWLCVRGGTSNWAGSETCTRVAYFRTISNIFIDYFYALLPIALLWNTKMKPKLKAIVVFLLGLGIFASSATIVKLVIIVRLAYAKGAEAEGLHYDLALWADIELGLGILAASSAALRPLLRRLSIIKEPAAKKTGHGSNDSGPYHELVASRQILSTDVHNGKSKGRVGHHERQHDVSVNSSDEHFV
ncbi:hypothetical protein F5Y18DRAFT_287457 [Xylariaceae sp. FL1019]|nr:hypothetical protein F5Y18DRAFT_287457 [Xylariaceae sp. FL1019]